MLGGKLWRRNTLLTALVFPVSVFTVFFIVNLFVWSAGSSGELGMRGRKTLLLMILFSCQAPCLFCRCWRSSSCGLAFPCRWPSSGELLLFRDFDLPFVFLSSYFGFKLEEIKNPVRFNQIPRQIPEQVRVLAAVFSLATNTSRV